MMRYTIIDDARYVDFIRIKTMWRGYNRYLWVYTKDLDDFTANPDSFRETSSLFETDAKWWHPGRKKYGCNGKILKWQRLIVKKNRISKGVLWFVIPSALLLGGAFEMALVAFAIITIILWMDSW